MGWLGLGPASLARRARRGAPPAISATAAPALGGLADGDAVQDGLSAGALDATSYASTEGAIVSVAATVTIDGMPGALTDTVSAGDIVSVVITVADDAGNSRAFLAGAQVVAGVAPGLAASQSLSGRRLTITVDSLTGAPAPSTALTALTLDGATVLGDQTGTGPWDYDVPGSASAQTVAWTVAASNFEGTATASGSGVIPANLFAPSPATAPSISGTVAPGETVTLDPGTYTGPPAPTVTVTLGLDGVDVTGDVSGTSYTIPPGTDGQSLTLDSTGSNGIAPDATQSVSETVQPASTWTPADMFGAGESGFAYDLMDLSVANTQSNQGGGVPGDGDPLGYLPDKSPNAETATQNTAAERPVVRIDANGVSRLEFDSDDLFVSTGDMTSGTWSVWMIYEPKGRNFVIINKPNDNNPYLGLGKDGDTSTQMGPGGSTITNYYEIDGVPVSPLNRDNTYDDAQNANLFVMEAFTDAPVAGRTWTDIAIGDYNNLGTFIPPGDVYAWGAINRTLTAAEKADLLAYADRVRGV